MADKIKKGDWNAQTTAILLIVAPILVILFNSLGPVNAKAGLLNFTFIPDTQTVIGAMDGNESFAQLFGVLLVISSLLIPLGVSGISRICQDDPGRKWAAFGFICTVISVSIWAVTNGVTAALADASLSYQQALTTGATGAAAAGAAGAAIAIMNGIALGSHQMATMIFMIGNFSLGIGMSSSGAFNSILSRLIALTGLVSTILVLVFPLSSDPGFAIVGILFLVISILWILTGVTMLRATR
jgi:hypothetical protein|tara:strand:- start:2544 stop:3269 length:726 start_codon:yes stop_codon:yes gene_type:complete